MTASKTNTQKKSSAALLPAIERLGLPVFLFASIFFLGTVVLTLLLTPGRFPVRIGERTVRLEELEDEQWMLMERKSVLEQRTNPVSPTQSPVLHRLTRLRAAHIPVGRILLDIEMARVGFRSGDIDPIAIPIIDVRTEEKKILLAGSVKDIGGRSMQILASFVDSLRAIPSVRAVTEPEYTQTIDPDGIGTSPFSLTLTLDEAS